jgi:hypothetical protein
MSEFIKIDNIVINLQFVVSIEKYDGCTIIITFLTGYKVRKIEKNFRTEEERDIFFEKLILI